MEIREVTSKESWEWLISQYPEANFLQSWNWGVFHQALGKTVIRVAAFEGEQAVAMAEAVVERAKRGTYMTVAGGPLLEPRANSFALKSLFDWLSQEAKKQGCQFIRVRPQMVQSPETIAMFAQLGLTPSPMHLTADLTLQLDLNLSEEELLTQMRKNTRYEVRQAEKQGIDVRITQDATELKRFYQDQLALAEKHGFVPFSESFLTEQFKAFVADDQVVLLDSYLDGQLLASAFVIFYNGEAVYHYGTSTPANAKLPGSYACQWAAIKESKRRGCSRYNFWGIAPEGATEHRFAGVSLFKRGFGGQEIQYLPAHDLPLSWQYSVTKSFEMMRKKLRKL